MRDRALGSTIRIYFTTHTPSTGVVVAPSSAFAAADFKIYKDGSATEKTSTNGITVTSPFDSQAGAHLVEIDTSNSTGDSGFWASGSAYRVVLSTAKTVDSKDPSGVCVGEFSLELQTADVRKFGGTAGTFSSGKPDVGTATSVSGAVGSVTGNVGGNVNGNVSGNVSGSVGSVTGAVGSVTGSVGSVVGNVGGSVASVAGAVGSVTGNVGGDVAGKVLGGGSGTISGDGVRAASVTGAVGSVTGSVGSVVGAVALDSAAILAVADQVWDEAYADHNTAGSFGKLLNTIRKANLAIDGTVSVAITPTTLTFSSNVAATTSAYAHAVLLFTTGALAGENSPIISYTNTNGVFLLEEPLTSAPSNGDEFVVIAGSHVHSVADIQSGLSTLTAPQVNSEVLDVLSVDTFVELTSPPAATSSLKDKLTWLFMWVRNKGTATATQRKLYADDGTTLISTEVITDDGTTFTKGEAS